MGEDFDYRRLELSNPHTGTASVIYVALEEEKNPNLYRDKETGVELNVLESKAFVEWIVENYKTFGTKLEFVTDRSQEGNQFCKGFGGIGGLLRYKVDFELMNDVDDFGDDGS